MTFFTLDASAWLRLFLGDGPVPEELLQAARSVDSGDAVLVAPELLLIEAAHVLRRKQRQGLLGEDEMKELWTDMRRTPIEFIPDRDHVDAAMEIAGITGLSVYDALYLAVARHTGSVLLTQDHDLGQAALKLR